MLKCVKKFVYINLYLCKLITIFNSKKMNTFLIQILTRLSVNTQNNFVINNIPKNLLTHVNNQNKIFFGNSVITRVWLLNSKK